MEYRLNKYDKAQMYLLYYMLKNDFVIFMYDSEKIYMPIKKYQNLASNISKFYKLKKENESLSFLKYCEKDKKLLQTLKEIEALRMQDTCTVEEIKDYIRTIKEYNFKNNLAELNQKLKNEWDIRKKVEIAQEMIKANDELNKFLQELK